MRPDLPSGTVTFLFTDVAGSTRLLHELGDERYAQALAGHRSVVRETCSSHGGVEVDTQGDAFFFAFPSAPEALDAAGSVADRLANGPIRIRMGLHTGTPLLTDEGYVGVDLHRAARIAAAGHGGQILLSSTTAALCKPVALRDLGEHRLKDLSAPERLYQVGNDEFGPLKTLYQTNLPVPLTPFVGRTLELAEVTDLIVRDDVRLLTLAGPGGTGKTRLAVHAAAEAAHRFPDGVWWLPLAPLRDPSLLILSAGSMLQVPEEEDRPRADSIAAWLGGKQTLLVLDNAEHLLPEVAGEVARLVDADGPTVVVTSRERLRLQGEQVWSVPPLSSREGVELFLRRAQALDAAFSPSPAVNELCDRLENLPLALELAAARTTLFTPSQLLERLSQRLDLLKGSRDVDPRQQTLRATLEWSYELLRDDELDLFTRLSVFAGGCTFAAAEEVCDADPDTLQSLIDKSLVRRRDTDAEPRYWMLETVREFALENLVQRQGIVQTRTRHARWCLELARRRRGVHSRGDLRNLELELPNVRLAAEFFRESGDVESDLDLLASLRTLWDLQGHRAEGLRLIEAALAGATQVDARLEALAWQAIATIAPVTDHVRRREAARRAVELYRSVDDAPGTADALVILGVGNLEAEDAAAAVAAFDEAASISRRAGYPRGEAAASVNLGLMALLRGDAGVGREMSERALAAFRELEDDFGIAVALENLAVAHLMLDDLAAARHHAVLSLSTAHELGSQPAIVYGLEVLAAVEARLDNAPKAARLLGAAEAIREAIEEPDLEMLEARVHELTLVAIDEQLSEETVATEWSRGRLLSVDEAAVEALG